MLIYFLTLQKGIYNDRYPNPDGSVSKESACNAGDPGSIPGSGRSPVEGNGNHSSIFVWEIQWTEEPGGLYPMGIMRVRHNLATKPQHPIFICLEGPLCPHLLRSITWTGVLEKRPRTLVWSHRKPPTASASREKNCLCTEPRILLKLNFGMYLKFQGKIFNFVFKMKSGNLKSDNFI